VLMMSVCEIRSEVSVGLYFSTQGSEDLSFSSGYFEADQVTRAEGKLRYLALLSRRLLLTRRALLRRCLRWHDGLRHLHWLLLARHGC
jgi:hypothetical protein